MIIIQLSELPITQFNNVLKATSTTNHLIPMI